MVWMRSLVHETDLTFGLVLSICLGIILGLLMGHPLGQLICGSAVGVAVFLLYVLSYSIGAIWMIGMQQGLYEFWLSIMHRCVLLRAMSDWPPQESRRCAKPSRSSPRI